MVDKDTGNPFADDDSSDDDDDVKSKKKKKKAAKKSKSKSEDGAGAPGSFAGSLRLKAGRNINNNLYYVDHTKLANNGNGLPPHERNDLIAEKERSRAEHGALLQQCKQTGMETARLDGEPRNEELEVELSSFESTLAETSEGLEVARGHAGSEFKLVANFPCHVVVRAAPLTHHFHRREARQGHSKGHRQHGVHLAEAQAKLHGVSDEYGRGHRREGGRQEVPEGRRSGRYLFIYMLRAWKSPQLLVCFLRRLTSTVMKWRLREQFSSHSANARRFSRRRAQAGLGLCLT